jgi:hypothetical protein
MLDGAVTSSSLTISHIPYETGPLVTFYEGDIYISNMHVRDTA